MEHIESALAHFRALLEEQKWEELARLVPPTTLEYLQKNYAK